MQWLRCTDFPWHFPWHFLGTLSTKPLIRAADNSCAARMRRVGRFAAGVQDGNSEYVAGLFQADPREGTAVAFPDRREVRTCRAVAPKPIVLSLLSFE